MYMCVSTQFLVIVAYNRDVSSHYCSIALGLPFTTSCTSTTNDSPAFPILIPEKEKDRPAVAKQVGCGLLSASRGRHVRFGTKAIGPWNLPKDAGIYKDLQSTQERMKQLSFETLKGLVKLIWLWLKSRVPSQHIDKT